MEKNKSERDLYKYELMLTIFTILVTASLNYLNKLSLETSVIIDVVTGLVGLSGILIKQHVDKHLPVLSAGITDMSTSIGGNLNKIHGTVVNISRARENSESLCGKIGHYLEILTGAGHDKAVELVKANLEKIKKIPAGFIPLTPSDYYVELIEKMENAPKDTQVFAISSITIRRWDDDPRQRNYIDANFSAIKNGSTISRIFLTHSHPDKADLDSLRRSYQTQRDNGVKVYVAHFDMLQNDPHSKDDLINVTDDIVLFKYPDGTSLAYKGVADQYDRTRIFEGERISGDANLEKIYANFGRWRFLSLSNYQLNQLIGPNSTDKD